MHKVIRLETGVMVHVVNSPALRDSTYEVRRDPDGETVWLYLNLRHPYVRKYSQAIQASTDVLTDYEKSILGPALA